MHTICSPYGQVLRIVIFKKNGVQTMVEYPLKFDASKHVDPVVSEAFSFGSRMAFVGTDRMLIYGDLVPP